MTPETDTAPSARSGASPVGKPDNELYPVVRTKIIQRWSQQRRDEVVLQVSGPELVGRADAHPALVAAGRAADESSVQGDRHAVGVARVAVHARGAWVSRYARRIERARRLA